ncbi:MULTISPECIES: hypothetical protein [unclassified Sporolactobacillus]|uniref:hypothetical protein n=1 Tax=unclassified Sporolactobacillus TaxID=2628533 RepID=UPI002368E832|nr:hypothetical protein [Sporolactobacillus sp. CQH2019]MDD9150646.1 hypothetical protein [Sporolactobacillus sp. CQH2019]
MPKTVSNGLKFIYLGICLVFVVWGLQEFLKAGSIYSLYGWCYMMLGTVSPAVVLLSHSKRRKEGRYLSARSQLLLEGAVLIGIVLFAAGFTVPIGFIPKLIMSLFGFFLAVPFSFVYLYLSPPKSSSRKTS